VNLLETTLGGIAPQDAAWRGRAHARLESLTMPHWAMGRVMDLAEDLAGIARSLTPPTARKRIVTMAGDHGVVVEGVSHYPQAVTVQMVHNFARGGAGINALARIMGAQVTVVDMGVASPGLEALFAQGKVLDRRVAPGTKNIAAGPAMTREQAVRALEAGVQIALDLAPETDVFATGEMGIGNTTPSTAIAAVFTGASLEKLTGRGTGIPHERLAHKISVIRRVLETNKPDPGDGLDVLSKVGGFEIGGLAGLILGAASRRKPVLIDGFISTAAALIAQVLCPAATEYMIASHLSAEGGHALMLQRLGRQPLLSLDMRLGEGAGAAVAMPILDAAVAVLTQVATFEEASVSRAQT